MAFITVDSANFESVISRSGIVLVDCWASWCGSCVEFRSKYERTAMRHPDHTFASLDSDADRELAKAMGITQLPTLLVYRDGILLFQQPGNFDEEELGSIVSQAESVDMDRVRAEIADREQMDSRHVN